MIRSTLSVTKHTPATARALVAAEHPFGAEVGAGILARGGNAVDAAVATAFAMTVVEPFMSSVAGGGTMLVHMAKRGETLALDFNVQAPAACHETCYELADGVAQDLFPWRRVAGDANIFGPRSVAIPGSVAGLGLALERFGTMDLADVLAPAIRLAEEGFVVDWYVALTTAPYCQELAAFPETARTYLRDGHYVYRPPSLGAGDVLRQPDLGRSLRLIAKDGPRAFYRGAIAQAIVEEIQGRGGFLTGSDLERYEPRVLEPLTVSYRGLELAFSPGATGGPTSVEMLNVLARFPSARVGYETPGGLHLRAEALRYAFADRLRHLGDARAVRVPWRGLVSPEHGAEIAAGLRLAGPRSDAKAPRRGQGAATARPPPARHRGRRLHHPRLRGGSPAQYGLADQHRGLALRLAHGRAGHRHSSVQRHALVRPGAGSRQLGGGGQAAAREHGARARFQARRALPHGRRPGRPEDRLGHSPGDLEHGRRARYAASGHRGAATSHGRR
jgi:gamma-glutamyltranspeptidase